MTKVSIFLLYYQLFISAIEENGAHFNSQFGATDLHTISSKYIFVVV